MRGLRHENRRGQKGFTIVEVLVGVALVLLSALIFATAFPAAGQARAAAEQNATALAVAEREIESIRSMPFESINTEDFEVPELRDGFGYVLISDVEGDANLKLLEVHIHWYRGDDPKELMVTSYVAEH